MNKIKIITDSTIDLSKDLIELCDVEIIPLHVRFDNDINEYLDGVNIDSELLYTKADENNGKLPKTSACSVGEVMEVFEKYINDGYDIIYTGISSLLSSMFQNATIASKEFDENRIVLIDSLSLSSGTGLLVMKIHKLITEGKSIKEIEEIVNRAKVKDSTKFCLDTLSYMYKGGRCSGVSMIFAHALHIHPVLKMKEGKLLLYKKVRGPLEKAVDEQIAEFEADLPNIDTDCLFITSSGRSSDLEQYIYNKIKDKFPVENIHITNAGCTIASHCGPRTIGILYLLK